MAEIRKGFTPETVGRSASNYDEANEAEDELDIIQLRIGQFLPLLKAVKNENLQLQQEIAMIKAEQQKLGLVGEYMLEENMQLRKHAQERSGDLNKLLSTIVRQANEQDADLMHEIHLVKETNAAIVKQINELGQLLQDMDLEEAHSQEQVKQLAEKCVQTSNRTRNLSVKNKQLGVSVEQLNSQLKGFSNLRLEQEVTALAIEVKNAQGVLIQNGSIARTLQRDNDVLKPHFAVHTQIAVSNIKELSIELLTLSTEQSIFQKQLEAKQHICQKKYEQSLIAKQTYERNRLTLQERMSTKAMLETEGRGLLNNQRIQQKNHLLAGRDRLTRQINEKKKGLRIKEEKYRSLIEGSGEMHRERILKLRQEVNNLQQKAQQEIAQNITPEVKSAQQLIARIAIQHKEVAKEQETLAQQVARLENPIKQILRLEYQLKGRYS